MIPTMTEEQIRQNLIDAGCDDQLIQSYMTAMKEKDRFQCSWLLDNWRRVLLDEIHGGEKRLDCLDYLRYQLQKQGKENRQ